MGAGKLRVGVIGTGLMGSLHAENLAFRIREADLAAVCDIKGAAAEACAERCGVDGVYQDYKELLAHLGLDAVIVSTPPDTHASIIEAAAEAGKHVFCEKPVDCDLTKIDRALDAVEKAGVKLQVGFNRRFDANFRYAHEAISSGRIGQLYRLHITSRDPVRAPDETPVFDPDMFLDTTVHDLDMARFLSGSEVTSVYVVATERADAVTSPGTAVTVLTLENGAIVTIDNSWLSSYGYDQRLEAFGSDGMIAVENELPHRSTLKDSAGTTAAAPLRFYTARYADSYLAEMAAFVECVELSSEPPVSGNDGRANVLLALAARCSWREGRAVAVSSVD